MRRLSQVKNLFTFFIFFVQKRQHSLTLVFFFYCVRHHHRLLSLTKEGDERKDMIYWMLTRVLPANIKPPTLPDTEIKRRLGNKRKSF